MTNIDGHAVDADRFREWQPFADAVKQRRPESGTWCEAWTVPDIVIHQSGNAEELARVLGAHLAGDPVPTRGFEEREVSFRAMTARLRVPDTDDVVISADGDGTSIHLQPAEGPATLETDAAGRVLLLWGRRPADPARICSDVGPELLGQVRTLLSGY